MGTQRGQASSCCSTVGHHQVKHIKPGLNAGPIAEVTFWLLVGHREDLRLQSRPTRGRFIFESPVEGKSISDIKTGFTGAVRAAGIVDLTFHDLRHTWSTRAAELGVPEPVRRDVLGHSSRTMTDSYTHSSREARERAVELVSEYGVTRTVEDCVKNAERPTLWLASRTA